MFTSCCWLSFQSESIVYSLQYALNVQYLFEMFISYSKTTAEGVRTLLLELAQLACGTHVKLIVHTINNAMIKNRALGLREIGRTNPAYFNSEKTSSSLRVVECVIWFWAQEFSWHTRASLGPRSGASTPQSDSRLTFGGFGLVGG